MTWSSTHTWWHIVHEVVEEIEKRRDGTLPWTPDYAAVFPEPHDLHLALRYFWQQVVAAQVDERREVRPGDEFMHGPAETFAEPSLRQVTDQHPGLRLVLTQPNPPVSAPVVTVPRARVRRAIHVSTQPL
jgi:hypothetical protein